MADLEDDEKGYLSGHGSVPPPQTVSKAGPRNRSRSDISIDDDDDALTATPGADAADTAVQDYVSGHGSVPPPQTVSKSGPKGRRRDDVSIDDDDDESAEVHGAPAEATASIALHKEEEDDTSTPWYMKARQNMIKLTEKLDPRSIGAHSFEMGELVRCKMDGDESWVTGHVTGLDPIQVGGSDWDVIRPLPKQETEGSPAGSPTPGVLTGFLDMFSPDEAAEESRSPKNAWYNSFNSFKIDGLLNLFTNEEPQKSPRHHFHEGETWKVVNEGRDAGPASNAAEPGSALDLAASFLSDCSLGIYDPTAQNTPKSDEIEEVELVSCLKRPDHSNPNRVKFDAVYMRQHEFVADGSGGLPSSGIPFGLGWGVESDAVLSLDEFEEHRQPARLDRQVFMMEGFVSPKERSSFAFSKGSSKEEVSGAELATFKANRRRRASLAFVDEVDGDNADLASC